MYPGWALSWTQCDPQEGLEQRLLRHEGMVSCPYTDHLGNWTIGIGHLLMKPVDVETCWSQEHAEDVLYDDIDRAAAGAERLVDHWYALSATRRDVLIEMGFQLGTHGLSTFRQMLTAIEEHDFELAGKELMDSRFARQVPGRARELACLLRG